MTETLLSQPVGDTSSTLNQTIENVGTQARDAFRSLTQGDLSGLVTLGESYVIPAAAVCLAIFIGYLVAKFVSRIISQPVCNRVDETLGKFVGRIVFYCILIGVVGGTLSQVGVKMGGLAAVLAAAGFAVGLAFQGTLSNVASGVLLLVFRPFKVGDLVNVAGLIGKVNEIDLFTTTLDTPDNRRLIVPNSSIAGNTIENMSYHPHRRVEVLVGVDYGSDLQVTRDALLRATESIAAEVIPGDNRGSAVILANLGVSSVDWKVRAWVSTPEFFRLTENLTAAIKMELDAAGIKIPFPQMDVHLHRPGSRKSIAVAPDTVLPMHEIQEREAQLPVEPALQLEQTTTRNIRQRPMLRAS
jgi:small conductance mechanosensitive channel